MSQPTYLTRRTEHNIVEILVVDLVAAGKLDALAGARSTHSPLAVAAPRSGVGRE